MYEAKRGRSGSSLRRRARSVLARPAPALLGELRRALEADELVLHYQPKVAVEDGAVIGRRGAGPLAAPDHGLLAPAEFVPLAERTGLMRRR